MENTSCFFTNRVFYPYQTATKLFIYLKGTFAKIKTIMNWLALVLFLADFS